MNLPVSYSSFLRRILTAGLPGPLPGIDLRAAFTNDFYYAPQGTEDFLSEVPGIVAVSPPLPEVEVAVLADLVALGFSDLVVSGVSGDTIHGVVYFFNSGDPSTSWLISYARADPPITPAGGEFDLLASPIIAFSLDDH